MRCINGIRENPLSELCDQRINCGNISIIHAFEMEPPEKDVFKIQASKLCKSFEMILFTSCKLVYPIFLLGSFHRRILDQLAHFEFPDALHTFFILHFIPNSFL